MDSGIYRLTYRNGATYVGKSIHLTTRWKQHFDKLSKGKAAKEMQAAFHASGNQFPRTEVLVYCHPDMLDYYEGFFINDLKPPLNTAIPQELPDRSKEVLVEHANLGFAKHSVITMLQVMHTHADKLVELEATLGERDNFISELEAEYEELSQAWGNRAVRDNWGRREYREAVERRRGLEASVKFLEDEVGKLRAWRLRVEGLGWWKRLWRLW